MCKSTRNNNDVVQIEELERKHKKESQSEKIRHETNEGVPLKPYEFSAKDGRIQIADQ